MKIHRILKNHSRTKNKRSLAFTFSLSRIMVHLKTWKIASIHRTGIFDGNWPESEAHNRLSFRRGIIIFPGPHGNRRGAPHLRRGDASERAVPNFVTAAIYYEPASIERRAHKTPGADSLVDATTSFQERRRRRRRAVYGPRIANVTITIMRGCSSGRQ